MSCAERGKFCSKCNKVVRDFTNTSDEELAKIFSSEQSRMCGKFLSSQLYQKIKRKNFWELVKGSQLRKFAASFVSLLGLKLFSAPHADAQTIELKNPSVNDLKNAGIEMQKNLSNDSTQLQISGTLRDSKTHEGIPFAPIVIMENGKEIAYAQSDEDGNFSLKILKQNLISSDFDIIIQYLGYDKLMIKNVPLINSDYVMDLKMQEGKQTFPIMGVIVSRLVDPYNTSTGATYSRDELKHLPR